MKGSKFFRLMLLCLSLAVSAVAQTTRYGDPNFVREQDWQSGMPQVLRVQVDEQVNYEFDGTPLEIPFTLTGTRARVWLAVYTKDANPQYGGAPFGQGGVGNAMLRAAGVDTMIVVTAGEAFSEGSHTIAWSGRDYHGNPVAPGEYDFYLFALDDVSNPTWTGRASDMAVWSDHRFDFRFNPPIVWSTVSGQSLMQRAPMGVDLFENPNSHISIEMPWMTPRRQEIVEGMSVDQWEIAFLEIDPNDPNVAYIGNSAGGPPTDPPNPAGLWKVDIDLDNMTVLPDETWAASDRGLISWQNRLFDSALRKSPHNPWNEDDGMIYITWKDREPPLTPGILVFDRATGELVNQIDLTDLYVLEQVSNPGVPYTPGPSGIDVDDTGIYISSDWLQPTGSFPAKFSLDGDLLWQNQNGDGFVDRYEGEEAEALGIVVFDQMVNTHMSVTRWGIAVGGGYNDPSWGYMLGPDGSGLLKFNLPHMPPSLGGGVQVLDNDSDLDGLWIPLDAQQLVHWPFGMGRGTISEGPGTAVLEIEAALPADFALGAAYPNPFNAQTAIRFSIADLGQSLTVRLAVYNTAGQQVATLVDEAMRPGTYEASWDGRDQLGRHVGSGVYLYRLTVGDHFSQTQRMTLLK